MRPTASDHAGIIAGFAASSLVMLKALFTEMPFTGYDARGYRTLQTLARDSVQKCARSAGKYAEIATLTIQTIAGASTGGRRGALEIRSTANAAASASMPAPTKAIV
jgi:hypothetical protein